MPVQTPDYSKHGLHGTGKLYTTGQEEIDLVFQPKGSVAAVLGLNDHEAAKGRAWVLSEASGHALTFGATRSGKGTSAIIPALLSYAGSAVVIDPKGENAWTTAPRRREIGHRVVILDHWGEVNRRYGEGGEPEQATRFNPLSALDPDDPEFPDDVALLADALIAPTGGDSHWTDSARELVSGLIAAVVERRPQTSTLRDVRRLLLLDQAEFAAAIAIFEASNPDGLGARKLANFKADNREVYSIRSAARTQTAFLDTPALATGMETDDPLFDLAELATQRVTLYLVLPVDRLQTHGRWLRLVLNLAIKAIARQAEQPKLPVLFLLDEMGTVGRLAMIEQAYGLMAGLGIRLWGFLQDLNQVRRDYPESWETFIANSRFVQILNGRDSTTCEYFSKYMGSATISWLSRQGQRAKERAEREGETSGGAFQGDEFFQRDIYTPDELRRIPNDQCLIIFTDDNPVVLKKMHYYADPRTVRLARALPQFRGRPLPGPPSPSPRREPTSRFEDFVGGWLGRGGSEDPAAVAPAVTGRVKLRTLPEINAEMKQHGWRYSFDGKGHFCLGPKGEKQPFASHEEIVAWWNEKVGRTVDPVL